MNYKNLLQEFCQSRKVPMPIYIDEQVSLQWKSKVLIDGKEFKNESTFRTKIDAQQYVAEMAYNSFITKKENKETQDKIFDDLISNYIKHPYVKRLKNSSSKLIDMKKDDTKKTIVLVDLENQQPNIIRVPNNFEIHCFMSSYCTVKTEKYESVATIHLIESATNNAADHMMSYVAGKFSKMYKPEEVNFLIISRDKSCDVLYTLLNMEKYQVERPITSKTFENNYL